MWNLKRSNTNKLNYKTERNSHTQKMNSWMLGEVGQEIIVKDFGKGMCTLLHSKWITNKNLLYSTQNSAQCYAPAWIRVVVWGRMDICIYVPSVLGFNTPYFTPCLSSVYAAALISSAVKVAPLQSIFFNLEELTSQKSRKQCQYKLLSVKMLCTFCSHHCFQVAEIYWVEQKVRLGFPVSYGISVQYN